MNNIVFNINDADFNNIDLNTNTYDKGLEVGDIVKIKNSEILVKVEFIDYVIDKYGKFDYAGTNLETGEFQVFNQNDVGKRINHIKL